MRHVQKKIFEFKNQENLNIFRKRGISIHKNYLKDKKQKVKSNMFNCLLNNNLLIEILQNCNILWNDPAIIICQDKIDNFM